ncbi:TetR/AcrR family transcriptional regulator [Pacificimonas sp. ICDLI1SI03]
MPKRDAAHMNAQRERILRAAIHCISNVGLERTSISAICKEAQLSAGALYKHFGGKDEIVTEALQFAAMTEGMLPKSWTEWRDDISCLDDQMGFSVGTVARAKLQLLTGATRPGAFHELVKPLMETSLAMLVQHLTKMEERGEIKLKMPPLQTAKALSAMSDGLLWIGLATDQPHEEISADIAAAFDCLFTVPGEAE